MNLSACPAGTRLNSSLRASAGDQTIEIPVVYLRGAHQGKTLVVSAGVHGDEFEGVRAIFEILAELDPQSMTGNLLCVPVANPPAFWAVSRCSPVDGGNLARAFPGRTGGTITDAIAHAFDTEVLPHADFYLDLHSAGVRCLMPTMVGYFASDSRAEAAALAFGAPVVWAHDTVAAGRTVSAASARNIPWLYTEARGAGRIHPDDLAIYRRGILNLLRHLDILPGEPDTSAPAHFLYGDGNVDASVSTANSGFLVPEVELLQRVSKGQTLGRLLNLHGELIECFAAPRDGAVALIHTCPAVSGHDPLFLITGVRR